MFIHLSALALRRLLMWCEKLSGKHSTQLEHTRAHKLETFSFLRKTQRHTHTYTYIPGNAHKCSTKWKSISFKRWQNNKIKDAYAREIWTLTRSTDTFLVVPGLVMKVLWLPVVLSVKTAIEPEKRRRFPLRCLQMSPDLLLHGEGEGGVAKPWPIWGWQFEHKRKAIEIAAG